MDAHEPQSPETSGQKPSAGQEFVSRIRPAGCVLFLALAILVAAVCLTSGRSPIPGYAPPETTAYYAENREALVQELETHVFPALPDYNMTAEAMDGVVVVTVDDADFVAGRAAILRYFDESLFIFERG